MVVNPDEEAVWNLTTGLSNVDDLNLKTVWPSTTDGCDAMGRYLPTTSEDQRTNVRTCVVDFRVRVQMKEVDCLELRHSSAHATKEAQVIGIGVR